MRELHSAPRFGKATTSGRLGRLTGQGSFNLPTSREAKGVVQKVRLMASAHQAGSRASGASTRHRPRGSKETTMRTEDPHARDSKTPASSATQDHPRVPVPRST